MAGERIADNSAFAHTSKFFDYNDYKYLKDEWNKYCLGSYPYQTGWARKDIWVQNEFTMYFYYKTSNGSAWYGGKSVYVSEGATKTLYGYTGRLRHRFRINVGGDGKSRGSWEGINRTLYYDSGNGYGAKVGKLSSYNNTYTPSWQHTKIYASNWIVRYQ